MDISRVFEEPTGYQLFVIHKYEGLLGRGWHVHRKKHLNKRGGCRCNCYLCVSDADKDSAYLRCICPDCNEECKTIGRLDKCGPETGCQNATHYAHYRTTVKPEAEIDARHSFGYTDQHDR